MRTISRIAAGLAVLGLVASMPASAQHAKQVIFTPYAAVYAPMTDLATFNGAVTGTSADVSLKHKTGFAFGANASYWLTDRTAIELGGVYAFSDAKASANIFDQGTSFSGSNTEKAHVLMGSVKAMFNLMPVESRWNLRFGAGPALIYRGGKAYDTGDNTEINGRTNFGGALSLCSRFALTDKVGLRLRVEDYMYQSQLKFHDPADPASDFSFDKKFQNDVMLSAGFQFTMPNWK